MFIMKLLLTAAFFLLVVTIVSEAHRRKQNPRNRHGSSSSSKRRLNNTKLKGCRLNICENSPVLRKALINEICPDPCEGINCSNRGTCYGGRCNCVTGFSGCDCQNDIDECTNGPCDVDATCTNTPGSFDCTCINGFSGDGTTCTDINECTIGNVSCDVDATCTNTPGSFDCNCNNGFVGNGTTCRVRECTENSGITLNIAQVNDEDIIDQVNLNDVCRNSCISDPVCLTYAVSMVSLFNECFLFSIDLTTVTTFVPDDDLTIGVCNCPTGTTCDERVCTEFPRMNALIPNEFEDEVFGSLFNQFDLNPVCRTRCRVNPLCNSFAFNIVSNTCVLFSIDVTEDSLGQDQDDVNFVDVCE